MTSYLHTSTLETRTMMARVVEVASALDPGILGERESQERILTTVKELGTIWQQAEIALTQATAILREQCAPELKGESLNSRFGSYKNPAGLIAEELEYPSERLLASQEMRHC